jgi:hypothetical protein
MCQKVDMTLPDKERNYLPRGETGTITMVLLAMNYVLKHYKHVTKFVLDDMSKRKCVEDDSKSLEHNMLFHYSIAFYGKTWYENKFGAYIDGTRKEEYDIYIARLYSDKYKTTVLDKLVTINSFNNNKFVLELYNISSTINVFFTKLKQHFTNMSDKDHNEILQIELCKLCSPWLKQFIDTYIFDNRSIEFLTNWYIIVNPDTIVKIREDKLLTLSDIIDDIESETDVALEDTSAAQ